MIIKWRRKNENISIVETCTAQEVRDNLFERESSEDLLFTGKVLYMMEDEAPQGLLMDIKRHIGTNLLRNRECRDGAGSAAPVAEKQTPIGKTWLLKCERFGSDCVDISEEI